MKTISMLEFRRDAEQIIRQIQAGERLVLTYRGKPVARLEPILEIAVDVDDPFYTLDQLADAEGKSLSNREMDEIIYAP
jgi:prevent-host-death family protein